MDGIFMFSTNHFILQNFLKGVCLVVNISYQMFPKRRKRIKKDQREFDLCLIAKHLTRSKISEGEVISD